MHLMAAFTLIYVIVIIVGRYFEIYERLDLPLPAASILLIAVLALFVAVIWPAMGMPVLQ